MADPLPLSPPPQTRRLVRPSFGVGHSNGLMVAGEGRVGVPPDAAGDFLNLGGNADVQSRVRLAELLHAPIAALVADEQLAVAQALVLHAAVAVVTEIHRPLSNFAITGAAVVMRRIGPGVVPPSHRRVMRSGLSATAAPVMSWNLIPS